MNGSEPPLEVETMHPLLVYIPHTVLEWEDQKNADSDTENEKVDPWDKLREEVINDLHSAREEQVENIYARVCQRMMLRLKLLTFCFLFIAKSYDTCIYITWGGITT